MLKVGRLLGSISEINAYYNQSSLLLEKYPFIP